MDLNTMEQKTTDCRYKTIYDFEIDALTIVHNVVLYQGGKLLRSLLLLSILLFLNKSDFYSISDIRYDLLGFLLIFHGVYQL